MWSVIKNLVVKSFCHPYSSSSSWSWWLTIVPAFCRLIASVAAARLSIVGNSFLQQRLLLSLSLGHAEPVIDSQPRSYNFMLFYCVPSACLCTLEGTRDLVFAVSLAFFRSRIGTHRKRRQKSWAVRGANDEGMEMERNESTETRSCVNSLKLSNFENPGI